tara:strand:+ start:512 stop:1306 length:795 start_codon:yes stop_codon:yes gene_type:complete
MTYVLGTHSSELERLGRQHAFWRQECRSGLKRAGFGAGDRLLDLGCGPGFCSLELAELVGPSGRVLGLDLSPVYIEHLQQLAQGQNLSQLQGLAMDLTTSQPLPEAGHWDGAWCRWLWMFLPELEPLLDGLTTALRPGGHLVLQEYIRWDSFALRPGGSALAEFVSTCIHYWREQGGDPDVASRLPELLCARGWRLVSCRSLLDCSASGEGKALWLQDFLASYPQQLQQQGLWSAEQQQRLEAEQASAMLWMTPTLVEQIWERP